MAIKVKCGCGKALTAPESAAGKRGKCPKCGVKVNIPLPQPVAEPTCSVTTDVPDKPQLGSLDDHNDEGHSEPELEKLLDDLLPEPGSVVAATDNQKIPSAASPSTVEAAAASHPSPQPEYDIGSLSSVHRGLNFVYYGILCIVIAPLVSLVSAVAWTGLFGLLPDPMALLVVRLISLVAPILINAGVLLVLIGRIMCLSVPKETKGSWAIYAAVACDIGTLLASVGYHTGMLPVIYTGMRPAIFTLLGLIGFFLFVFFLKKLAFHIRDGVAEQRADTTLKLFTVLGILAVILVAGILLAGVFLLPEEETSELLAQTLTVAIGVVAFVTLIAIVILYVMLLISLRRSLSAAEAIADHRKL